MVPARFTNRNIFLDFLGLAAAFGALFANGDVTVGGYIVGLIFFGVMTFVGMAAAASLKGSGSMYGFLGFLIIGLAAPALFGWFPAWVLVFVLMLAVAMAISASQGAKIGE